jgi:hypothetical protein
MPAFGNEAFGPTAFVKAAFGPTAFVNAAFALTGAASGVLGALDAGLLAIRAFLATLRALTRDFFWIVILSLLAVSNFFLTRVCQEMLQYGNQSATLAS